MKRNLMQEKFERVFEPPPERHDWVSPASARQAKASRSQSVAPSGVGGVRLNRTPPGDNIADAQFGPAEATRRVMSGETDVSQDWNKQALANGFKRLPMSPVEDQESNEHNVPFYDDATADGQTGFCERNNVLDRQ